MSQSIPITAEHAKKLIKQLEPATPGVENPYGDGFILDPSISMAISLKRIADVLEKVVGDERNAGLLYYLSSIEMNGRNNNG